MRNTCSCGTILCDNYFFCPICGIKCEHHKEGALEEVNKNTASKMSLYRKHWFLFFDIVSGNQFLNQRQCFWKCQKYRQQCRNIVFLLIGDAGPYAARKGEKRAIILTRHYGPKARPFDQDNLAAGCKYIVDALKVKAGVGWIYDDCSACAAITYSQKRTTSETGLEVEILW